MNGSVRYFAIKDSPFYAEDALNILPTAEFRQNVDLIMFGRSVLRECWGYRAILDTSYENEFSLRVPHEHTLPRKSWLKFPQKF